jgi:hypothetical protein
MCVEASKRAEEDLPAHSEIALHLNNLCHLLQLCAEIGFWKLRFERRGLGQRASQSRSVHDAVRKRVVGGLVLIQHAASVGIELGKAEREQLHQLARVIFIGRCALGWVRLIVIRHVQIAAHSGIERDGFDDVAIIVESVIAKDSPVGRKRVSMNARLLGDYPDFAERERHTLAQLILPGNGILKEDSRRVETA